MDSSTLILIVALTLSIVAGPAIGFALARRRLAARDRVRSDRSARYAGLDESLRHLSPTSPQAPTFPRAPSGAGFPGPDQPGPVAGHPLAARRFEFEPPVFGAPPSAGPARSFEPADSGPAYAAPIDRPAERTSDPAPQARATGGTPSGGVSSSRVDSGAAVSGGAVPGPAVARQRSVTAPAFRPIADLVNEAVTRRLAWLDPLSGERLLTLHELGYDDPVKIANLRSVEISRLARALEVTEVEIETEWIPAARRELGIRHAAPSRLDGRASMPSAPGDAV